MSQPLSDLTRAALAALAPADRQTVAPPLARPDPADVAAELERDEQYVHQMVVEEFGEPDAEVSGALTPPPEQEVLPPVEPRPVSARRKLRAKLDEQGDALAEHAVDQALRARGKDGAYAVARLLDVADAADVKMPATAAEVDALSFTELRVLVARIAPEKLTPHDLEFVRARVGA